MCGKRGWLNPRRSRAVVASVFDWVRGRWGPSRRTSSSSRIDLMWGSPMWRNQTVVTVIFLVGFQGSQLFRNVLFLLFLVVFCTTICGNLLIIVLVSTSRILHTPMYFFISQLSTCDILLSLNIVPNLFHLLLNNGANIRFADCFTQFYFFCALEVFECVLLSLMSYDRYVAICNPLRYTSIMTSSYCVKMISFCYFVAFLGSFIVAVTLANLRFCGAKINHFFCDFVPLLELVCSFGSIVYFEIYGLGFPIIMTATTIIAVSYTFIVLAVLRISTSTGRQKAFFTCSSHLIVVSIFYTTLVTVYIILSKLQIATISKVGPLLYTVFTPFINPIIYSFRNKDIKKAAQETFHKQDFQFS
ncbi:hypothetical protein GDO81_008914 [Engystomops pustulosus]|uniref:Olfactory receptor n=1 Tax=Engystomops pustulosus TaxID=76066 RepID=A0AAV7BN20_ENGPU|nr:hypothetical protein GDO81_008914 [Engystomops pustulosus]